jgi:hypothetical protein
LAGRICASGPGRLELRTLGRGAVEVTWPGALPFELVPRELDDPAHRRVWGDRLIQLRIDASAVEECEVVCRRLNSQQQSETNTDARSGG